MLVARFSQLLEKFDGKRVAILGDFILDEYLIGNTRRVSREAPVVVIDYEKSEYLPGGAANAAQNVAALKGRAGAYGIVGDDQRGGILARLLESRGADIAGLILDPRVSTAVKTRIVAGDLNAQKQQVARIDRPCEIHSDADGLRILEDSAGKIAGAFDAVLISDYGFGIVPGPLSHALIRECRERGVPVVVDSRFNLLGFPGASVGTPNEVELLDALGVRDGDATPLAKHAARAVEEQDMRGLIVTRGSRGMAVFGRDGATAAVGIVGSRDATDVTGAGDTVSAAVALSLACGATMLEAAEMATYAAAVVVMKRGTATVSPDELSVLREKYPDPDEGARR